MLSRRIIPCLDVRDGRVVKGVRFRDHVDMGDIVELALRYRDAGADELVFYDVAASPEGRSVDRGWVERVARLIDIPFCVAGGIRGVEDARAVLHAGADKISINTPALERPALIAELADHAQSIRVWLAGLDVREAADAGTAGTAGSAGIGPAADGAVASSRTSRGMPRVLRSTSSASRSPASWAICSASNGGRTRVSPRSATACGSGPSASPGAHATTSRTPAGRRRAR